jgi:4-amino-4-deoxy-L-arabinose transferase-like glycosyltransferase
MSTLAPRTPAGEAVQSSRRADRKSAQKRATAAALAPRLGLVAVLALSAVLNTHRLAQNGYANVYYSAGVKSMLGSLHNLLFVSFDPGALMSIDKPPLGLWVQVASAKLFGFSPLSLLLPEAIAGVLGVAALYWAMTRTFGSRAALASALALAVFPSFVAVSRDNNLDAVLILLMVLACGAALRAVERGRWRALLACAVLVGLAFNTKTLAAYLIVPGIALAYALCAPGSPRRRTLQLLAAGALAIAVSFAWIALVELTPAAQRPYVGGSLNNTELGLTFEYNGLGRVSGEVGGPGEVPAVPLRPLAPRHAAAHRRPASTPVATLPLHRPQPAPSLYLPNGRLRHPVAFGGATGPLRLFDENLGDQGGWMLPFALLGLLAIALTLAPRRRVTPEDTGVAGAREAEATQAGAREAGTTQAGAMQAGATQAGAMQARTTQAGAMQARTTQAGPRDPRLAGLLVFGGWFLLEAAVLSLSKGIVHPYYISALGPGSAAMVGAGAFAFVDLARRGARNGMLTSPALVALAVGLTVVVQVTLLNRVHYLHWFLPALVAGAAVGVVGYAILQALHRHVAPAMALILGVLLIAPGAYAATTWEAPVEGTFPAAGPLQNAGYGGLDVIAPTVRLDRSLIAYLASHGATRRWTVLTEASDTAAPLILLGSHAGALGGYSANDPTMNGAGLARLVARGQARYVVLGGAYSTRGGNRAINAVPHACRQVPGQEWGQTAFTPYSLMLFDCSGRERELAGY